MRCLTSARFRMDAEVLRMTDISEGRPEDVTPGVWETSQDPISGEIINVWVPGKPDNPQTPTDDPTATRTINCLARGVLDGGVRLGGSSEKFGDIYASIDLVKMWVPASENILKSDRITNIRSRAGGVVIWKEEDGTPTVFNVEGVVPLFDPFDRHIESLVMLERVQ